MQRARQGNKSNSFTHTILMPVWLLGLAAATTVLSIQSDQRGKRLVKQEAAAVSRGRDAEQPSQMPVKGWKDVLIRTYEEFMNDRLMLVAAGLTFYVLLAIFPAISALVSIYGLFSDPVTVGQHLDLLAGFVPAGGMDLLAETMTRLASRGETSLSISLIISLGIALWSANSGMKSMIDALNIVYGEREKRSFIKLTLISFLFTFSMLLFVIIALSAVIVLPTVLKFIGMGAMESWLLFLRWPVVLLVVMIGTSLIFRYGPSRQRPRWRWVTWGSFLASVLWVGVSIAFSWYVENFSSYDETYGSLGAAIGFMTWIWISSMVILLGAEINAELEHQTTRDTTTPPEMPMGMRGAVMADTVGEAKG